MDKSYISNLISFLLVVLGYSINNNTILTIGLFALSGSATNSIAIYMLFEKVPLLYGSGVIEDRFAQFKLSIHNLIMIEFFTKNNIDHFFKSKLSSNKINFEPLLEKTDFTPAFESLKSAVMESSFGSILSMFGGVQALESLKDPFELKIKSSINKIIHTNTFQNTLKESLSNSNFNDDILNKIDSIVNERLDQLTPKMVKKIIQELIHEHLGWLVVWGAVFGGLIGLISSFFIIHS
ncbi:hypothetical protein MNB_ARC-1_189 [hydrothermal vent metagenome]|uniref:DUF445 domain-containing protein n=1 Tax=hydrothermal vent metagenome TaxID=652676 RepID=A0A3B1E914_9ZZZZ